MNVEENEIECEDCGHKVSGNLLKENFIEIHEIYKEAYNVTGDAKNELIERVNGMLLELGRCPVCGSILRKVMCKDEHMCVIFKKCPICGKLTEKLC